MKLTPARRLWLELLREHGWHPRTHHGPTCVSCHNAGWCEWVYRREGSADIMTMSELKERYGDDWGWETVRVMGERLTEEGRKVLEQ